tara:strand:+ start:401 stop:691 length:291 start_codon:yes stop_codon:yes gene_type:complete
MPYGKNTNNRYYNSNIIKKKGKKVVGTVIYSPIPESSEDVVVKTVFGDRFDLLAEKYYGDSSLWWYIAKANNKKLNTIEEDTLIVIPSSTNFAKEI